MATVLLAACGGSPAQAVSAQPDKIVMSNIGIGASNLPLLVAQDAGIFKKNGLDVSLQQVSSNSGATVAALVANQIQVAWTSGISAVDAAAGGADVVVVAVMHPAFAYVIDAAPSITTPEDLKGKTVAVNSATGTDSLAVRVGLAKVGVNWKKDGITFSAVGSNANRTAALVSGAAQAAPANPPGMLELEAQGFHRVVDLTTLNAPAVDSSIIVGRAYLAGHRPLIQRYVDSLIEGVARLKKDRPFAIGVLKKYLKSDDDQAMSITYNFHLPVTPSLPYPDAALFGPTLQALDDPRLEQFDVSKIVDRSLVADAAARKVDQSG